MNQIQTLRILIGNIEKSLNLLASPDFAHANDLGSLQTDFKAIKAKFSELSRLTNKGRATSELRVQKMKLLKNWLQSYSNQKNQLLDENLPKKYKNKDVIIDDSTLEYYKDQAGKIIKYMTFMSQWYQYYKNIIDGILQNGKLLDRHLGKFELLDEDLPSKDLLLDDDTGGIEELDSDLLEEELDFSKVPTVAPAKMIKSIGSVIKTYIRFIKKVIDKYEEIRPLVTRLESVNVEDLFPKLNERNDLIINLFKNLVQVNKIIYQGNFKYGLSFRRKYYDLLLECLRYLPEHLGNELRALTPQVKSKMEEAIDHSRGNIRDYNPGTDPEMSRASPHLLEPEVSISKLEREMKSKEVAPTSPEPVSSFQSQPPDSGVREIVDKKTTPFRTTITPEEKAKYQALWEKDPLEEVSARFKQRELAKLAKRFSRKYQ